MRRNRPVIVHYHLFKNAGTSLDRTLRENLGAAWAQLEADAVRSLAPDEIAAYLLEHPTVSALSSHTAALPPPEVRGITIIPLILLRHPVDRARSIHAYEQTQTEDTPGSLAARNMSFAEYVDWRLDRVDELGDRTIANFQCHRLAHGADDGTRLDRARRMARHMAWVGIVEEFEDSIALLAKLLSRNFPRLNLVAYRENATGTEPSVGRRLEQLRAELGPFRFARLYEANRDDLELWAEFVSPAVREEASAVTSG